MPGKGKVKQGSASVNERVAIRVVRVLKILTEVSPYSDHTVRTLSELYGCSVYTVYRDLAALRLAGLAVYVDKNYRVRCTTESLERFRIQILKL